MQKMKRTENFEKEKEHAVCESITFDGGPQDFQEVFTDLRPRAEPETLLAEQPAEMQREQASPASEQQRASGSGTVGGLLSVEFAFEGAVDPDGVRKERCPEGVSRVRKHHAKTSGIVNEMSRQLDPNQLVRTADVGKTRTADLPPICLVKYNCNRCGYDQGPFVLSQSEDLKPGYCPECHSLGTFTVKKKQKMKRTENFEKAKEHAVCESIAFDGGPQDLQEVFTDLRPRVEPETLLVEKPADMQRQLDMNQLVRTADVGKTRTADLPHIYLVKYNCNRCDYDQGPFVLWHSEDLKPGSCPECHSYGTFTVKKKQVRRGIIC
ncbi:putative DNA replication licensing factor MCM2 [Ixodes scapularis]